VAQPHCPAGWLHRSRGRLVGGSAFERDCVLAVQRERDAGANHMHCFCRGSTNKNPVCYVGRACLDYSGPRPARMECAWVSLITLLPLRNNFQRSVVEALAASSAGASKLGSQTLRKGRSGLVGLTSPSRRTHAVYARCCRSTTR
jgi:hypothetical protein